jgi:hypothetical protein
MILASKRARFVGAAAFATLLALASRAGAQGAPAPPQRHETLDANRLASIAAATKLPKGMKRSRQLDSIVSQLRLGNTQAAVESWKGLIAENRKPDGQPLNIDELIKWVLREAYLSSTAPRQDDLVDKVRFYDELDKKLREEITLARTDLREERPWPRKRRVVVFRKRYARGKDPVEREERRKVDKKDLTVLLKEYEMLLRSIGDDREIANVEFQNLSQKQQQTMQMLGQISKQLSDTALAVIRKIGNAGALGT